MSGSRRGRRQGWERERWKERQEREKKERRRDRDGRKKDRETGAGEREIGRETGVGERGEKEKKLQTQTNSWNFILSCYNPLSYFNPVTRDKVGKKKIERETGWEREREKYN